MAAPTTKKPKRPPTRKVARVRHASKAPATGNETQPIDVMDIIAMENIDGSEDVPIDIDQGPQTVDESWD
jgi:hypothetical protein